MTRGQLQGVLLSDYTARSRWIGDRPRTLVVGCSDGRLQQAVDEFLHEHLGIAQYDRCYVPGGAGALTPGGLEFTRASQMRKECSFLIQAHGIERTILMFHGPAPGGPGDAVCGDYRRRFPSKSVDELTERQNADAREIVRSGLAGVPLEIYRCEATGGGDIRFVEMKI